MHNTANNSLPNRAGLENSPAAQDLLLVVFLRGGMDGLNAVIPYGDPGYYAARKKLAIPAPAQGQNGTGIDLDGFFCLHPALEPFKEFWDAKSLAVIHAAGSPAESRSHFDGMDFMERGTPGQKVVNTGWLGRHLQSSPWQNKSPFRAIAMGGFMQASLRGPVPVTTLRTIDEFRLLGIPDQIDDIRPLLETLYQNGSWLDEKARISFESLDQLSRINTAAYVPAGGVKYPDTDFGIDLLQIAQIVKADIGVEIACADIGSWDTHSMQGALTGEQPELLGVLADGLSAFFKDMQAAGRKVTIVTMSEFGRRVHENGSFGTDHGHGNCMFVIGQGVNGGKVYGEWPTLAEDRLFGPGDLAVTTDYRDVLAEILVKRIKNPNMGMVFPGYTVGNFLGIASG